MRATRAIIRLDNLRGNIAAARNKTGGCVKICLPVKADAYGHGALMVSRAALEAGVEYLGTATVAEGSELRAGGISAPILLFSQCLIHELPEVVSLGLIPLVSDREYIEDAARAAKRENKLLTVHLKLDTGMGRLGCRPEEAADLARLISSTKSLALGGIATHFSVSDSLEPDDVAYTKMQINRFREAVSAIRNAGIEPGIVHAANSGALVFHEDSYFDMVRPGIFLYGYSPAAGLKGALDAAPVMELRSAVVSIKKIKKGEAVSYGRTWTAPEDTLIAVIPAGYADGFPRALSNNHSVLIRGRAYPLAGRICMDQCMANLGSGHDVRRWDDAVIFGPGFINAAELAKKINTIPYEITCNINKRVPRIYEG